MGMVGLEFGMAFIWLGWVGKVCIFEHPLFSSIFFHFILLFCLRFEKTEWTCSIGQNRTTQKNQNRWLSYSITSDQGTKIHLKHVVLLISLVILCSVRFLPPFFDSHSAAGAFSHSHTLLITCTQLDQTRIDSRFDRVNNVVMAIDQPEASNMCCVVLCTCYGWPGPCGAVIISRGYLHESIKVMICMRVKPWLSQCCP